MNSPTSDRARMLYRRYEMTTIEYGDLLAKQGGVCAICGEPPDDGRNLSVDHHHGSGETRGLLCWRCNIGLGNFAEDPERLEAAIHYLRAHRGY